jgi:nitrogen fixation NifU-like protein
MSVEAPEFLQSHSMKFLEMAFRSDRMEPPERVDGQAEQTGDCGDSISMSVALKGDRVLAVRFTVNGCLNTVACANAVGEMAEGRAASDAWEIRPEDVAAFLETLPEDHFHCAELAVGAFYRALADSRRNPWKGAYR